MTVAWGGGRRGGAEASGRGSPLRLGGGCWARVLDAAAATPRAPGCSSPSRRKPGGPARSPRHQPAPPKTMLTPRMPMVMVSIAGSRKICVVGTKPANTSRHTGLATVISYTKLQGPGVGGGGRRGGGWRCSARCAALGSGLRQTSTSRLRPAGMPAAATHPWGKPICHPPAEDREDQPKHAELQPPEVAALHQHHDQHVGGCGRGAGTGREGARRRRWALAARNRGGRSPPVRRSQAPQAARTRDEHAAPQGQAEQQLERDRGADDLCQVACHDRHLGHDPQRDAHPPGGAGQWRGGRGGGWVRCCGCTRRSSSLPPRAAVNAPRPPAPPPKLLTWGTRRGRPAPGRAPTPRPA
jgi:hypothetical protein